MRRGDVFAVVTSGDFGKPRPAVIIQSDALSPRHGSIVICPMTSSLADAPHVRVTIEPSSINGLRVTSQVMVDKPTTLRREKFGQRIGRLTDAEMVRVTLALGFVVGLSD